jgi:hypothetical protein
MASRPVAHTAGGVLVSDAAAWPRRGRELAASGRHDPGSRTRADPRCDAAVRRCRERPGARSLRRARRGDRPRRRSPRARGGRGSSREHVAVRAARCGTRTAAGLHCSRCGDCALCLCSGRARAAPRSWANDVGGRRCFQRGWRRARSRGDPATGAPSTGASGARGGRRRAHRLEDPAQEATEMPYVALSDGVARREAAVGGERHGEGGERQR